jgi:surface polysaccharide O-acyltransferase-like enzyme
MRLWKVDLLRVLAMFAVVWLHIGPWVYFEYEPFWNQIQTWCRELCRFAVPSFLVLSGYFVGCHWQKLELAGRQNAFPRYLLRQCLYWALLWFLASLLYLLPYRYETWAFGDLWAYQWTRIQAWYSQPEKLLLEGSKYHLWFLNALVWVTAIGGWAWYKGYRKLLLGVAVLAYLLVWSSQTWLQVLGVYFPWNLRNGPTFALLPFVMGLYLAHTLGDIRLHSFQDSRLVADGLYKSDTKWQFRVSVLGAYAGFGILGFGFMHMLERWFWWQKMHLHLNRMDLSLSVVLWGFCVAFWFIWPQGQNSKPNSVCSEDGIHRFGQRALRGVGRGLASWGPHMLGVYLLHLAVMDVLHAWRRSWDALWYEPLHVLLVFGVSLMITGLFKVLLRGLKSLKIKSLSGLMVPKTRI